MALFAHPTRAFFIFGGRNDKPGKEFFVNIPLLLLIPVYFLLPFLLTGRPSSVLSSLKERPLVLKFEQYARLIPILD